MRAVHTDRSVLFQTVKARGRMERRGEVSCFRALSSLKEGGSNPSYATLQHYGSDLMSSH